MADTRRTFAQLYALFADNTVGAISEQDLRDFVKTLEQYHHSIPPTANDDSANTSGNGIFTKGSPWYDTTAGILYKCVNDTPSAASWVIIGYLNYENLAEETAPATGDKILIHTADGWRWIAPATLSSGGVPTQIDANGTILDIGSIADGLLIKRAGTTIVGSDSLRKLFWQTGQETWDGNSDAIPLGEKTQIIANVTGAASPTVTGTIPFADLNVLEFVIEIRMDATGHWPITWPANFEWVTGEAPDSENMLPNERGLVVGRTSDGGTTYQVDHNKPQLINYQIGTSYTIQRSDAGKTVRLTNASPIAVTLETEANSGFPKQQDFATLQFGDGAVTVTPVAGVTLRYRGSSVASVTTAGRDRGLAFQYQGSDVWVAQGVTA